MRSLEDFVQDRVDAGRTFNQIRMIARGSRWEGQMETVSSVAKKKRIEKKRAIALLNR